jgi:hypothetical protein
MEKLIKELCDELNKIKKMTTAERFLVAELAILGHAMFVSTIYIIVDIVIF